MKVLEMGPKWSYKMRCTGSGWAGSGCGALLEIEEDDVFESSHTDIAGDTEYYFSICCPVCNQNTDVNKSVLPEKVKMKASSRLSRYEIER